MSSRDTKIKRTLLESGLGLLAKEYENNPNYEHTRIILDFVPDFVKQNVRWGTLHDILHVSKRKVKGRTLHDILHERQVLRTHTYAR